MIALFDVSLEGFTIQFKDKEQMEANKGAEHSRGEWSEKRSLEDYFKGAEFNGMTIYPSAEDKLLVYAVVQSMTGGPNHFRRVVIDRHVIVNSTPVRIVSMKISNE